VHLRVIYYSKNEYAIDYDVVGLYEDFTVKMRQLLLLAVYLFRVYINLGNHPVGKLLSLILISSSAEDLLSLSRQENDFPSALTINNVSMILGIDLNIDINILHKLILSKRPIMVNYKGEGIKKIYLTLSPCHMQLKGFGLLGKEFGYCAFHSIFGIINKVANNKNNPEISTDIKNIVSGISNAYLCKKISPFTNAEYLSLAWLNELNIS